MLAISKYRKTRQIPQVSIKNTEKNPMWGASAFIVVMLGVIFLSKSNDNRC